MRLIQRPTDKKYKKGYSPSTANSCSNRSTDSINVSLQQGNYTDDNSTTLNSTIHDIDDSRCNLNDTTNANISNLNDYTSIVEDPNRKNGFDFLVNLGGS